MGLRTMLPDTDDVAGRSRRIPTDYVTNRVESSADTVSELSIRIRDTAIERATDTVELALENFLRRYGFDEDRLDERTLESIRNRLAAARSLEFYERDDIQTLLWARTLGDTPIILGSLAFSRVETSPLGRPETSACRRLTAPYVPLGTTPKRLIRHPEKPPA